MQHLKVSGAVRPIYGSLDVKRLRTVCSGLFNWSYVIAVITLYRLILIQFLLTGALSAKLFQPFFFSLRR